MEKFYDLLTFEQKNQLWLVFEQQFVDFLTDEQKSRLLSKMEPKFENKSLEQAEEELVEKLKTIPYDHPNITAFCNHYRIALVKFNTCGFEIMLDDQKVKILPREKIMPRTLFSKKYPKYCDSLAQIDSSHIFVIDDNDFYKELLQPFHDVSQDFVGYVVKTGQLDVLEWVKSKQMLDESLFAVAIKNHQIEVLSWLLKNIKPSENTKICAAIARRGDLEMLKLARNHGWPWGPMTCIYAAKRGHLEVLKWARENGCAWDAIVCTRAAQFGHLEVLKWARENGCLWHVYDVNCKAALNGHLEILKWVAENDTSMYIDNALYNAALNGHLEVLKWAQENDCNLNKDQVYGAAVLNGHLNVIKWLYEDGDKYSLDDTRIVTNGHLNILLWAKEHRWTISKAVRSAAHIKWPQHFK